MRCYKVEFIGRAGHEASGQSAGFEFFKSKRDAQRKVSNPEVLIDLIPGPIIPIDVEPTKAGFLHALNRLAGHPDNGPTRDDNLGL